MRIRADVDAEFYEKGFTSETDPFGRADLADRLTKLYKQLSHGTVSIIDGRWGSGKTIFARQWQRHLENNGVPCIYFDAFSSDYLDSPFRAVAAAFVREAKAAQAHDVQRYRRFLSAASKAAKIIAAPAAKMAVKAVTLGIVGAAEIEEIKSVAEEVASGLGDVSDAAVQAMLEEQAGDEANFAVLRSSLASLPSLLAKNIHAESLASAEGESDGISLVVIIDELDRCRPDFSLGILETLKHFFRADRVHFVLITNLDHLQLSVQNRYGVGNAAGEYIQKFYDFLIPFESRQPRSDRESHASCHATRLLQSMLIGSNTQDGVYLIEAVSAFVLAYDLSLRQAERIVTNIVLAQIDFSKKEFRPSLLVALLSVIKAESPSLFSEIKRGKVENTSIEDFILRGRWPDDTLRERIVTIARYHANPIIDEESEEFKGYESSIWQYNFHSRLDVFPYLANSVIDRFA